MDVELSQGELARYAEQIAADDFGERGQRRLKQSRALVVGAGPLGAGIAGQLASSGVGYVGVVDGGVVSQADLAAQTVHFGPDIGSNRADSVAGKLGVLNADVQVDPYPVEIDSDNADAIVIGHDLVVSSLRDEQARLEINDACMRAGIAMIDCFVSGSRLSVQTAGESQGACLRCAGVTVADGAGVPPGLNGLAAAIAAQESLRLLDVRAPIERRIRFDSNDGRFEQIEIQRREDCEGCAGMAPVGVEELSR